MILMVGSPAEDEVAKKSRQKSCRWQGVLTMEVTFDSYTAIEKVTGGETRSDGLSELTTRQNSNPKNSDLLYGSDTMLRENEFSDFH